MNGSEPRIEIFKPFGEAFELTKKILFQPFNLSKWCVIGFAAFLAGGVNFNFGFRFPFNGGGNWNFRSSSYNPSNVPSFASGEHIQPWVVRGNRIPLRCHFLRRARLGTDFAFYGADYVSPPVSRGGGAS